MLLLSPVTHLHYFCLTFPLAAGLLAHHWQRRRAFAPGVGLLALFAFGTLANLLPHIPAFELVRHLGLAMYAALAVWLAALVTLWGRTRKAAGAGTEGLWRRLAHGTCRLRRQPYWEQFAGPGWADNIMRVAVADRFHAKQGRTIVRWALEAGGKEFVVYLKRHYRLPWWRGLMALLHPEGNWSPALREWENLQWARARGLPVPVASAGGEFIGPWGRFQSFLAVEELTGMLGLHEAIPLAARRLTPRDFRRWKRGLIAEMASLVLALHTRRYFHKDLYLCHFYVAEDDTGWVPPAWRGRVRLIDLHRLARHSWTWPRWRAKDLGQLLYSSDVSGVTARDRVRFWRAYLAGDGARLGRLAGWLRRSARLKAWNYHRHDRRKAAA
jgi:heptose I phosphotransferase